MGDVFLARSTSRYPVDTYLSCSIIGNLSGVLRKSAITWALPVEKMSMLPSCSACSVVWLSSMTLKVILSR